jgi:tetratricopeptide (TPR) repeat protein
MMSRRQISAVLLFSFCAIALVCVAAPLPQVPRSVLGKAADEFREGNAKAAEQTLRTALRVSPRDPAALGLLGVVLDTEKRYDEAEAAYKQALLIEPGSPALLNNLGNHYLAQGKDGQARTSFLKVLAVDPKHSNANLQMAYLSAAAKQGSAALKFLNRLAPEDQASPPVQILRARALRLTGQKATATDLLEQIEKTSNADPRIDFSIGMTFVEWQLFTDGEKAFARALDSDPTNFDILYNLGLAAQHAGHLSRAAEVYQVALRQRPDDADCLFNLASIYTQTGHSDEAIVPLMRAHNAAPERTDILLALAQNSQDIGFYGDAVTAINQYLKLKPYDDVARRERGFCLIRSSSLDQGLADLRWYTQKHPKDARGFYELGIGETVREQTRSLEDFTHALALDPKLNTARYARGVLYYQMGKTQESIADLKQVVEAQPDDFPSLDALAQDYMRLNQWKEANELLERAYKLSPKNAKILTHYSRVLERLGRKDEAEKLMVVFRDLGPEEGRRRPNSGLFDYLSLSPQQQYAKYMENLQRTITTRPNDPTLRVQLGETLLRQGKDEDAIKAFRTVLKLTTRTDLLNTCGKDLLDYGQYALAREFLEPLLAVNPADAVLRLNLAIAVFHSGSAVEALKVLEGTSPDQRKGDYFLLRAQILDAMNRPEEAAEALNHAFNAAPTRPDLYFEAALFLIKHKQYHRTIRLLEKATGAIPDAPELQLTLAMTYGMAQEFEQSTRTLTQIESRWPEWSLPYEIHGISLETRLRSAEALQPLETAISLGAHDGNVYYYLASALSHAHPEDVDNQFQAIQKALALNPKDAYVQSLAGRIAYERKDYKAALGYLDAALRLWPDMIEAHQNMAGVYRAMGNREKSAEQLKEVLRIKEANPTADQNPPLPASELLFAVQPPAGSVN